MEISACGFIDIDDLASCGENQDLVDFEIGETIVESKKKTSDDETLSHSSKDADAPVQEQKKRKFPKLSPMVLFSLVVKKLQRKKKKTDNTTKSAQRYAVDTSLEVKDKDKEIASKAVSATEEPQNSPIESGGAVVLFDIDVCGNLVEIADDLASCGDPTEQLEFEEIVDDRETIESANDKRDERDTEIQDDRMEPAPKTDTRNHTRVKLFSPLKKLNKSNGGRRSEAFDPAELIVLSC